MKWKPLLMKMEKLLLFGLLFSLTGCSYNPFLLNNHTTGSPVGAVAGASIGAGTVALLGGDKSLMLLAGIGGGVVGYYATTLRYDSGGIIQGGGQVYTIGKVVGIDIPSDRLFEPNTDILLPQASPILDSVATVLNRYPNNDVTISGNTSGFYRARWEQYISEKRAEKVASYLWDAGVNDWKERSNDTRKLRVVGYGDYFPIANKFNNRSLRQNSHIQIISSPTGCDLGMGRESRTTQNMAALDTDSTDSPRCSGLKGEC